MGVRGGVSGSGGPRAHAAPQRAPSDACDHAAAGGVDQHLDYTLIATCRPSPRGDHCMWTPGEDRSTAELYVAWPDETGAIARAAVADVFLASAGTVALDSAGAVHIALYGEEPGMSGALVRYLRIRHGEP